MATRTGGFPIGLRRGWTDWQKDMKSLASWAKGAGFEAIDLGGVTADDAATLAGASLRLGSVDLLDFGSIMASDPSQRKDVIEKNVTYVKRAAAAGAKVFFTCLIPGDPSRARSENYRLAVESYAPICKAIEAAGGALAIEGWPGGAPHLANLCCTPETCRSFLKDVGSKAAGLNYDPSHLIRLGVDPIRFLKEFLPHIHHVHAKDTAIDSEGIYELGRYQSSAFGKPHGFGEYVWRYTIPGHGETRWVDVFNILKSAGYKGIVSVELEDENFNGSEPGEKAGFTHSLAFLRGA